MFNITPQPRMLLGVQSQKWNISGALAELVDNAFGPGRGNANTVKIVYDASNRALTFLDDGHGMEYIGRLFQLGNTIGHTAGDIGHFGSGGTQAIIWLAEWVLVATERDGKIMHDSIRWSDIFAMEDFRDVSVSNEWQSGEFSQFSEFGHGTAIRMKLLKARKINITNVLRDLSRLFAPGLRHGKNIIWCQQRADGTIEEHALTDPFHIGPCENTVRFDIVVDYEGKHLPVHGLISFNDNTSHVDSVVRVGLGYREIMRTRDCFKSENEAFAGIGVSGWLDLGEGWQEYLATTKDSFNDQPLYDALMEHVFKNIRELLVQAEQRTVYFELDNLAIGLQIALEKTMQIKVTVKREEDHGPTPCPDHDPPNPDPDSNPEHEHIPNPQGDKDTTATAHIRLIKQNDDDMLGALARAGDDPLGLYVDINRDHAYVREAMRQRPINSAALNLMIITEIAALLSGKTDLAKKAFKKSLIDELERRDGHEKVRMLVRHLIDGVPGKGQIAVE
jgi:hypothetical protein